MNDNRPHTDRSPPNRSRLQSMFSADFLAVQQAHQQSQPGVGGGGGGGGGLSAASSRRPSYAAEFSSRPRLLDSLDAFAPPPPAPPPPPVTTAGLSTGPAGPSPTTGSLTGSYSSPLWSDEFGLQVPSSQKKSFRSVSFSQPPAPAHIAHGLLDTFKEEEDPDSALAEDDDRRGLHGAIGQPGASLWFGPPPGSRRHSYAGEPPKRDETGALTASVDKYFSVDEYGRNSQILSSSSSSSPSSGSPLMSPPALSPADAASLISVPSKKLYFVQFKAGRLDVFFIPDSSTLTVKVGDLVIVDADRGRDLGKVVKDHVTSEEAGLLKLRRHQEQQAILQHNPSAGAPPATPGITMPKQILRYAQANEIQQIGSKQADEEKAVAMCVHKVQEKGLDMSVLDAEYQWDRRKLTFFYSASHRIDFRDLVRELFRIYKTRIWMCAVSSKPNTDPNPDYKPEPQYTNPQYPQYTPQYRPLPATGFGAHRMVGAEGGQYWYGVTPTGPFYCELTVLFIWCVDGRLVDVYS
jgi:cell fate regulator YaaT (PSP1 superfamily)